MQDGGVLTPPPPPAKRVCRLRRDSPLAVQAASISETLSTDALVPIHPNTAKSTTAGATDVEVLGDAPDARSFAGACVPAAAAHSGRAAAARVMQYSTTDASAVEMQPAERRRTTSTPGALKMLYFMTLFVATVCKVAQGIEARRPSEAARGDANAEGWALVRSLAASEVTWRVAAERVGHRVRRESAAAVSAAASAGGSSHRSSRKRKRG